MIGRGERVALVTGAAQGIGRAVAERLAGLGHHVVLLDRDGDRLRAAVADIGAGTSAFVGDVVSDVCARDAVAFVERGWGRLDMLVNNAGISPSHGGRSLPVEHVPLEEWDRVIAVNLTGTFLMCRAALPLMKRGGWGRIINFSSQGGRTRSLLSGAHYAATKAGLIGFTRVLRGKSAPTALPPTASRPAVSTRSRAAASVLPIPTSRRCPSGGSGEPPT